MSDGHHVWCNKQYGPVDECHYCKPRADGTSLWQAHPYGDAKTVHELKVMTDPIAAPKLWDDWVPVRKISIELEIPTNEYLYEGSAINGHIFDQLVDGLRAALGIHLMGESDWEAYCLRE